MNDWDKVRQWADKEMADARALWAVRVLDAHCRKVNGYTQRLPLDTITHKVRPALNALEPAFVCQTVRASNGYVVSQPGGGGATEDAARIAAAEALVAADPSLGVGL